MLTLFEGLILLLAFLLAATVYWYVTIPKNLPPGPIGLPFIGSSIDYRKGSDQHLVVREHVKKYGPIISLYIANKLVVVLGNFEAIQEALVKQGDLFAGRPKLFAIIPKKIRKLGVIFSEGNLWKEHRRFALSTLRDFGVGRPILEEQMKEEVDQLGEHIDFYVSTNTPFDPQRLITCAVSNIISQLVFGHRFAYDDEEFVRQFAALTRRIAGSCIGFLSPFFLYEPLARLMSLVPFVRKINREANEFVVYTERELKKTAQTFDPDSEPTNYIHAYMKESRDHRLDTFTDDQLLSVVVDLFIAGTETTTSTTRWAILLLAHFPHVQQRMYQEIKEQIGTDSPPRYADKVTLPFCEAVIIEIQRFANLLPFGVARRTLGDSTLMGYDIPEDTIVIPFLTNVLHNPAYEDPMTFDPNRFLDADGKVVRDPNLILFQLGKRICLGESLARLELFLLLTSLISRYDFYFPNDNPKPTLKPVVGLTCIPAPYQVLVKIRKD